MPLACAVPKGIADLLDLKLVGVVIPRPPLRPVGMRVAPRGAIAKLSHRPPSGPETPLSAVNCPTCPVCPIPPALRLSRGTAPRECPAGHLILCRPLAPTGAQQSIWECPSDRRCRE